MSENDDYVPGAVEEDRDYTKDDRVSSAENPLGPTNESVGDDEGFVPNVRPDVTPNEIEKGSFRFVGPGIHTLYVKDVQWADGGTPAFEKPYVKLTNGEVRPMSMDCRKVKVVFAVPGDENLTISDMFLLPPAENQMEAYEYGYKNEVDAVRNDRSKGGFHAKKLKHFLDRLGFQCDSQGKLPPSAGRFANWKKYPGTSYARLIKLEVRAGKAGGKYIDKKTGEEKESRAFNNIVMFSYSHVAPPADIAVAQKQAEIERQKAIQAAVTSAAPAVSEPSNPSGDKPAPTKSKAKKQPATA